MFMLNTLIRFLVGIREECWNAWSSAGGRIMQKSSGFEIINMNLKAYRQIHIPTQRNFIHVGT